MIIMKKTKEYSEETFNALIKKFNRRGFDAMFYEGLFGEYHGTVYGNDQEKIRLDIFPSNRIDAEYLQNDKTVSTSKLKISQRAFDQVIFDHCITKLS